ncbi:hypothetical protein EV360DRAFT_76711 [Lentinula raphanica]|nr:hypothetical protein EV360DRAFT_76711 [Lentinula raphanica]
MKCSALYNDEEEESMVFPRLCRQVDPSVRRKNFVLGSRTGISNTSQNEVFFPDARVNLAAKAWEHRTFFFLVVVVAYGSEALWVHWSISPVKMYSMTTTTMKDSQILVQQLVGYSALDALAQYGSDDEESTPIFSHATQLVDHESLPLTDAPFDSSHDDGCNSVLEPTNADMEHMLLPLKHAKSGDMTTGIVATSVDPEDVTMASPLFEPSLHLSPAATTISSSITTSLSQSPQRSSMNLHKPVPRKLIRQFLDVEALDDEDDGSKTIYESDISEVDFIDNSVLRGASVSPRLPSTSSSMAQPDNSTTRFIHHLEETYVRRPTIVMEHFDIGSTEDITRANHQDQDWIETLLREGLHQMKTGPEPWIGARVRVVQGTDHGLTGTVRDVNRYQFNSREKPRASGIVLTVELDVARGNVVSPRVKLNYDFVWELRSMYIPTRFFSADAVPARAYTPVIDRDSLAKLYELVGAWYPALEQGGIPSYEVNKLGPHFVASPTHFLCHRNLLGIPIRVDIIGGPYDTMKTKAGERYVVPTPAENNAILLQIDQPQIKVGNTFVDTTLVLKHRNHPKPSTEKRLMVVVGGAEEHIGRLVRRIHHFYKGSKSDKNKWFKLVVVEFKSEQEVVTGLELELHPNDVEYVREIVSAILEPPYPLETTFNPPRLKTFIPLTMADTRRMTRATAENQANTRASKRKARNGESRRQVMESVTIARTRNQKKKELKQPSRHSTPIPSAAPGVALSSMSPVAVQPEEAASPRNNNLKAGWSLLKSYSNDEASANEVFNFLKTVKDPELDKAFADIMGCEPDENSRRDELYKMIDTKLDTLESLGAFSGRGDSASRAPSIAPPASPALSPPPESNPHPPHPHPHPPPPQARSPPHPDQQPVISHPLPAS